MIRISHSAERPPIRLLYGCLGAPRMTGARQLRAHSTWMGTVGHGTRCQGSVWSRAVVPRGSGADPGLRLGAGPCGAAIDPGHPRRSAEDSARRSSYLWNVRVERGGPRKDGIAASSSGAVTGDRVWAYVPKRRRRWADHDSGRRRRPRVDAESVCPKHSHSRIDGVSAVGSPDLSRSRPAMTLAWTR